MFYDLPDPLSMLFLPFTFLTHIWTPQSGLLGSPHWTACLFRAVEVSSGTRVSLSVSLRHSVRTAVCCASQKREALFCASSVSWPSSVGVGCVCVWGGGRVIGSVVHQYDVEWDANTSWALDSWPHSVNETVEFWIRKWQCPGLGGSAGWSLILYTRKGSWSGHTPGL